MSKRKEEKGSNTAGFQKDVYSIGTTETDKEIKVRLAIHKKEIEEFYQKHPSLRRTKDYKDER